MSIDLYSFYRPASHQLHLWIITAAHVFYLLFLAITLAEKVNVDFILTLVFVGVCMVSLLLQKYTIKRNNFRVFLVCAVINEVSVCTWASRQQVVFESLDRTQKIIDLICLSCFVVCNVWAMVPAYRCVIEYCKYRLGYSSKVQSFTQMV